MNNYIELFKNGETVCINSNFIKLQYKLVYNINVPISLKVSILYRFNEEDKWENVTKYTTWNNVPISQVIYIPKSNSGKIYLKNLNSNGYLFDFEIITDEIEEIDIDTFLNNKDYINNEISYNIYNHINNDIDLSYYVTKEYLEDKLLFELGEGINSIQQKNSYSKALGPYCIAIGYNTVAGGAYSLVEGAYTYTGVSKYTFKQDGLILINNPEDVRALEQILDFSEGSYSHAEGIQTFANGCLGSHAEGQLTVAIGQSSHTEGSCTVSRGGSSHAEGTWTQANGLNSHTEGFLTVSRGDDSHAEGMETYSYGNYSHTEGSNTCAYNYTEHAEGSFNISHNGNNISNKTQSSIGIGSANNRMNAFEVMQNGDIYIYGIGNYDGKNINNSESLQNVINDINDINPNIYEVSYNTNENNIIPDNVSTFISYNGMISVNRYPEIEALLRTNNPEHEVFREDIEDLKNRTLKLETSAEAEEIEIFINLGENKTILPKSKYINNELEEFSDNKEIYFLIKTNCKYKVNINYESNEDPQINLIYVQINGSQQIPSSNLGNYIFESTHNTNIIGFTFNIKNYNSNENIAFINTKVNITVTSINDDNIKQSSYYIFKRWNNNVVYEIQDNIDLSTYATQAYVIDKINNIPSIDLSSYATKQFVENKHYLTEHQDLSSYVTYTYLNNAINSIESYNISYTINGETTIDLSNYISLSYFNNILNMLNDEIFILKQYCDMHTPITEPLRTSINSINFYHINEIPNSMLQQWMYEHNFNIANIINIDPIYIYGKTNLLNYINSIYLGNNSYIVNMGESYNSIYNILTNDESINNLLNNNIITEININNILNNNISNEKLNNYNLLKYDLIKNHNNFILLPYIFTPEKYFIYDELSYTYTSYNSYDYCFGGLLIQNSYITDIFNINNSYSNENEILEFTNKFNNCSNSYNIINYLNENKDFKLYLNINQKGYLTTDSEGLPKYGISYLADYSIYNNDSAQYKYDYDIANSYNENNYLYTKIIENMSQEDYTYYFEEPNWKFEKILYETNKYAFISNSEYIYEINSSEEIQKNTDNLKYIYPILNKRWKLKLKITIENEISTTLNYDEIWIFITFNKSSFNKGYCTIQSDGPNSTFKASNYILDYDLNTITFTTNMSIVCDNTDYNLEISNTLNIISLTYNELILEQNIDNKVIKYIFN